MSSYGTYLSASGMMHASNRIDVISNNLANVESAGFKRTLATIAERRPEDAPPIDPQNRIGGGPWMGPTVLDMSQGAFEPTGNPLDIALLGPGFIATTDDQGENLRLSRDGGMAIDDQGFLVTDNQFPRRVLDVEGEPINLRGISRQKLYISKDGSITDDNSVPIARLGFFEPNDPAGLKPEGGNQFLGPATLADTTASAGTELRSGFVERSNVDPIVEMTRMLEAQRQLEANAKMIQQQDTATDKLVNIVGKVS